MNAFVYQASLWCGPCIRQMLLDRAFVEADFDHSDHEPAHALESALRVRGYKEESDYDSDELPKGPYPDGGGEADTPQHCDACQVFLENPLTEDGYVYIRDAVSHRGREFLREWVDFYEI